MATRTFHGIVTTPAGTPLGGWVDVEVSDNGDYHVKFHMHSSSVLGNFDFNLRAYLTAPGFPMMAFIKSGHVSGVDSWDHEERGHSPLLALYWFHVPFRGSFVALLISSALFMVVVLALGFFISVVAKNQLAASQMALLATFLPAFLLSGFLYAIEQMPVILQWITRILPARYYVSLLKKIFLKGTATSLLYADLIPLTIFALVLTVLATRSFHKRLV